MSQLLYNLFYYKTLVTSYVAPQSSASKALELFAKPTYPKKDPEWEIEFEKEVPHNIINIPYKEHIEAMNQRMKDKSTPFEITLIPNLPETFACLEYLPDENAPKREETVICIHGWGGKSLNFFKFIKKLQSQGFRVLAPDFPQHGLTGGTETGCHIFGHTVNALIRYLDSPVYLLAHSLGNVAFCVNYAISSEHERSLIKRYVGIACPDQFQFIMRRFMDMIGLSNRAWEPFVKVNDELHGIKITDVEESKIIEKFHIPIFIIHDENDKELKYEVSKVIGDHLYYKHYKVGSEDAEEKPSFYTSKGLGHRRILRDDGIVDHVSEFFSEKIYPC